MKMSDLPSAVKESSVAFWNARDSQERMILTLTGLALGLGLMYAIFFGPALDGRAQLNQDLPKLRQQAAELRTLAQQAVMLNSVAAPAAAPITQESIAASLAARGMKAQSVVVTDDVVRVQLNPVSFSGLLDWLDEQQKTSRLAVLEANFVAQAQLDMVNASLSLKQQGEGKIE